jgi:phenylacetate-CoA ligase
MRADRVYRWLVPRVVTPLGERVRHPRWTTARHLAELQWQAPEELEQRAVSRLRALLEHASRHVPHYRDLLARARISPHDIQRVADLARIPVSAKADLRAGFPARTTADNVPAHRWQPMMTSGSTGRPFEFYWDRAALAGLGGTDWFWLQWAGTDPWHTRIVIASPAYFYDRVTPPGGWRRALNHVVLGERTERLPADQLSTADLRALVERVTTRGPYFIRGYPGALARLARRLVEEGAPPASDPRVVVTFAETLTPAAADLIRRGFRSPVVDYYSCWEVPQIAQTCPDNPETLHVNAERVIARVARPDGGNAMPGEIGRVVLTDLANFVMPFINYAPGDYAVAGGRCPCGRGLPTLARIEGRDSEVIRTLQGREISGVMLGQFLTFVVGIIPYVWEYQAVQTASGAVTLRVVPTAEFTSTFRGRLERALGEFLGPEMTAMVEPVDAIPLEPSGKRLIIKPLAVA